MTKKDDRSGRPDATREALVKAGISLFGRHGFEGASTRAIAAEASANIAAIAYHFGGKEGLRLACADWVAQQIESVLLPALGTIGEDLPPDAREAESRLSAGLQAMAGFIVGNPQAGPVANFILREQSEQTPAFDLLYNRVFRPLHERICVLWGEATGLDPASPQVRLATFSQVGQVIYFRIGRNAVMRRMGWADIGPQELSQITLVVRANLMAALQAARNSNP